MKKRLSLRIDDALHKKAILYASAEGKTLNEIITEHLYKLTNTTENKKIKLSRKVKRIAGKVQLPAGFDLKKELAKAINKKYAK